MMRYFTLLKANIRRQKGSFIGVFVLIFLITVFLCAVLAVWGNSSDYEREQLERLGYGDFTNWVEGVPDIGALEEQISSLEETAQVKTQQVIWSHFTVNGKEGADSLQIMEYNQEEYPYFIFNGQLTAKEENPVSPGKGEIYVPPSFSSLYEAKPGDEVAIQITGKDDVLTLKIKGFFEDPFMGSTIMGMKTVLVNAGDWRELVDKTSEAEEDAVAVVGNALHISYKPECTLSVLEYQKMLYEETDLNTYTAFSYQKAAIFSFMLMLQNIFAGFLLLFVVVLLVVTVIVIGHSISSSIEQDYVNMGILKAVGYSKNRLRFLQILQYLAAILAGMGAGVPAAVPIVRLINKMTVTATGLMVPPELPMGLCMFVLAAVLVLLVAFIVIKTIRIGSITPLQAIRNGTEDVYFKSRLMIAVRKRGLHVWLAFRQLVSGKKQYVSTCLVSVLLVFSLSMIGRIGAWMGNDGEGLKKTFDVVYYDIALDFPEPEGEKETWEKDREQLRKEAEDLISSYTEIVGKYETNQIRGTVNNADCVLFAISDPEQYNLLKGRTCKYDNEIIITEFVAEALNVDIGDTVTVDWNGSSEEYIITGFYQCTNDMGVNCSLSKEGLNRLGSFGYVDCYALEDSGKSEKIAEAIQKKFGDAVSVGENDWSGMESILAAMNAISIFMYVIVIIFILVVIALTGSKILYKEQHDLGIYKSLGFTSKRLRLLFAIRFLLVASLGSVAGILLSAWGTDPLASAFLRFCGVSRFTSELNLVQMLLPAIFVVLLFGLFAYLAAGRIRKVEPNILIVE